MINDRPLHTIHISFDDTTACSFDSGTRNTYTMETTEKDKQFNCVTQDSSISNIIYQVWNSFFLSYSISYLFLGYLTKSWVLCFTKISINPSILGCREVITSMEILLIAFCGLNLISSTNQKHILMAAFCMYQLGTVFGSKLVCVCAKNNQLSYEITRSNYKNKFPLPICNMNTMLNYNKGSFNIRFQLHLNIVAQL